MTPEQVTAAGGRVRCGQCLNAFHVRGHLVDDLPDLMPAQPPADTQAPPANQMLREEATRPDAGGDVPAVVRRPSGSLASDKTVEKVSRPESDARHPPSQHDVGEKTAEQAPTKSTADGHKASAKSAASSAKNPLPELLKDDAAHLLRAPRTSWYIRLFQLVSVVLLLLASLAQIAWFMPTEFLRRFPEARPWLSLVYGQLGRELPVPRDPSRIQLLSRDVRVHPQYRNVLVINAKVTNKAAFPQPYPSVWLTVFGVNGRVVGARGFRPEEYLTPAVDRAQGMLPEVPVQIGFEVVAPETAVVSYEFSFL